MPIAKFSIIVVILMFVLTGASVYCQSSSSNTWRIVDAEGLFTFSLPPDMKQSDVRGIDSSYREYDNGKLTFSFVYEPNGVLSYGRREMEFGKGFQEVVTDVAGTKAYLFLYERATDAQNHKTYHADIYLGDFPNARVRLWMWARSTDPNDITIARKIFNSVEFLKDKARPTTH